MLYRTEQVGSEAAFFGIRGSKSTRLNEPGEERLRQVLGVARRIPAAANEDVKRIPVSLAEFL